MTVFLTGLMQKAYSNIDLISLSVGLYGIFVTCQNTALTLLGSLGVVKGGIFMVVTLLVVGVFGMWIHRESCEYATVRVQILVKRQAAHTRRIPPIFHTAYRNAVGLCLFVFEIVYDTITADTACK